MSSLTLVASFIKFLKNEIGTGLINAESSESIESNDLLLNCDNIIFINFFFTTVAIQCLTDAFGVNDALLTDASLPDLKALLLTKNSNKESDKAEAERHKLRGNEFMASKMGVEAVDCYTKAINFDCENAIVDSNR